MEKKRQIKISLKTVLFIIIFIFLLGITAICEYIERGEITPYKIYGNIYTKKIDSITIQYYEGYNFSTGRVIGDTIPLNTIHLSESEIKSLTKSIHNLRKLNFSTDSENYSHLIYDNIVDYYKLELNNEFVIYIGDKYGCLENTNDYFKLPDSMYKKIINIINKYNEKNLYEKINSETISIITDTEVLEITDKEQIKTLSNHSYYIINASDKDFKDEEIIYTLDLGDGQKIEIFRASVLSRLCYKDGTHKYIYTNDLEDYVEKIFNNSKVQITDSTNSIVVTYKTEQYIINDQKEITKLLKEFKNLEYNDYNYLKSMSEDSFDDNDIKILVNNSKYIIPGESSWASRFYIDENGKLYDVTSMENTNLEAYFKKLVNYKE